MTAIQLIKPTLSHQAELIRYKQAYETLGKNIDGGAGLEQFADDELHRWLTYLDMPTGTNWLGYEKVADSTFLGWDNHRAKMVGIINIRHTLNDYLRQRAGHIGYSVHPDEWNKGYATQMLALALTECDKLNLKEIMITCHKHNLASRKVIEKNGFQFDKEIEIDGEVIQHFWLFR